MGIAQVTNYPNPFKDSTEFIFNLDEDSEIVIKLYTLSGRLVRELMPGMLGSGYREVDWDGKDSAGNELSSGVYYYKIIINNSGEKLGKLAIIR